MTCRAGWDRRARARAPDRIGHEAYRLVLPDHALVQLLFHRDELLTLSPCIIFDTGMPVARDTTSAISSAPTCVRSSFGFAFSVDSAFFSCASSWGSLPYCSSASLSYWPFLLKLGHLLAQLLDLFLDVLAALDLCLLGLPLLLEVGVLLLQAFDFFFN